MDEPLKCDLLAAILCELRIANDLKACELDSVQNRFGDESLVFAIGSDRHESYDKWPRIRQLFGVKR